MYTLPDLKLTHTYGVKVEISIEMVVESLREEDQPVTALAYGQECLAKVLFSM